MMRLPDGEKILFIRFDRVHERDGQTNVRTDTARRHRPCVCIATCDKTQLDARYNLEIYSQRRMYKTFRKGLSGWPECDDRCNCCGECCSHVADVYSSCTGYRWKPGTCPRLSKLYLRLTQRYGGPLLIQSLLLKTSLRSAPLPSQK